MNIINLTPHDVNIVTAKGEIIHTFPKCDNPARLKAEILPWGKIAGVPISKTYYSEEYNLPEFQEGVYYIVSQLVKNALPKRSDLLVPAEVVRDENNVIIGCASLGL